MSKLSDLRNRYVTALEESRALFIKIMGRDFPHYDEVLLELDRGLLALTYGSVPNIKQATLCLSRASNLLDNILLN